MARRQCLRLITVDETTVSSSLDHLHLLYFSFCSASLISLLQCIAPFFFFFCSSSASTLLLHRVPCTTSLIFSSFFLILLFFFEIFLISFYFVLRTSCLLFLFDTFSILFASSSSFSIVFFISLVFGVFFFPASYCASFLLLSHTSNTRVRRPRVSSNSTFRIVIEREHDR